MDCMKSIIKKLSNNMPTLKANYPLLLLGVFGSYSCDEETTKSDLGILYKTLPNTYLYLHNYLSL